MNDKRYDPIEVGSRIRKIRQCLGWSMEKFASEIDDKAKSGTVSNWETGKNLPNNERLKRIAEIGKITLEDLLSGNVPQVETLKHWSFTMDYETDEIVINTFLNEQKIQLRACEKDIKSMASWFDLARHMKKNSNS